MAGSDRIDEQLCDLKLSTTPASNGYPTGPEIILKFLAAKSRVKSYLALLSGIAALVLATISAALFKDYPGWGVATIAINSSTNV